jgi:hypothetical protein
MKKLLLIALLFPCFAIAQSPKMLVIDSSIRSAEGFNSFVLNAAPGYMQFAQDTGNRGGKYIYSFTNDAKDNLTVLYDVEPKPVLYKMIFGIEITAKNDVIASIYKHIFNDEAFDNANGKKFVYNNRHLVVRLQQQMAQNGYSGYSTLSVDYSN